VNLDLAVLSIVAIVLVMLLVFGFAAAGGHRKDRPR